MSETISISRREKKNYRLSQALKMIWDFFYLDIEDIKILMASSLSYGFLTLTIPLGVQVLINRILSTAMTSETISVISLVTLGLSIAAFLRVIQRKIVERIQRRFHSRITLSCAESLHRESKIRVSHLYYDTFIVQKSLSSILTDGFGVIIQLIFALILLAFYHPFFLAFDILIIVGLISIVGLPASSHIGTAIYESKGKHNTSEFLENLSKEQNKELFFNKSDEAALNYLKSRSDRFKFIISQMIGLSTLHILSNTILLGAGSYLVIQQQMSVGQLVAAEMVFSSAFVSVEKLNKHLETFFDMIAAIDKLTKIVDRREGATDGI